MTAAGVRIVLIVASTVPVGFSEIIASVAAEEFGFQILRGPSGTGKFLAVEAIIAKIAPPYATMTVRAPRVADARAITAFCSRVYPGGVSAVGIDLDGATAGFYSGVLKLTEELPRGVRVVASASGAVPVTILSRAQITTCPALTSDQVREVLVGLGYSPAAAISAAALSGGRVSTALAYGADVSEVRAVTGGIVAGVRSDDPGVLVRALSDVCPAVVAMLGIWAVESISGRARVFDSATLGSVEQAGKVLAALDCADPVLGVQRLIDATSSGARFGR